MADSDFNHREKVDHLLALLELSESPRGSIHCYQCKMRAKVMIEHVLDGKETLTCERCWEESHPGLVVSSDESASSESSDPDFESSAGSSPCDSNESDG